MIKSIIKIEGSVIIPSNSARITSVKYHIVLPLSIKVMIKLKTDKFLRR